eukprot:TRINITY_DN1025_c0_g1_i1.p1 TRINITY_DN1025_c0_g1~~TRINITY_DN1025_c0_g1_i1.p1  ORF type:complete len:288 (+),score=5.10 TRINITY_DN1025_c0_g1_i1:77-865(+)
MYSTTVRQVKRRVGPDEYFPTERNLSGDPSKSRSRRNRSQYAVLGSLLGLLFYFALTRTPESFNVDTSAIDAVLARKRPPDYTITARCSFDVESGGKALGRVVIGLYGNTVPRTAENFRSFCMGWQDWSSTDTRFPKRLQYAYTRFFDVEPGHYVAGGDVLANNGSSGRSIYGAAFHDENFKIKHTVGTVTMGPPPARKGRHQNGSQFLIVLGRASEFDGKHVAFGTVVSGLDVVKQIVAMPTDDNGAPRQHVFVKSASVLR